MKKKKRTLSSQFEELFVKRRTNEPEGRPRIKVSFYSNTELINKIKENNDFASIKILKRFRYFANYITKDGKKLDDNYWYIELSDGNTVFIKQPRTKGASFIRGGDRVGLKIRYSGEEDDSKAYLAIESVNNMELELFMGKIERKPEKYEDRIKSKGIPKSMHKGIRHALIDREYYALVLDNFVSKNIITDIKIEQLFTLDLGSFYILCFKISKNEKSKWVRGEYEKGWGKILPEDIVDIKDGYIVNINGKEITYQKPRMKLTDLEKIRISNFFKDDREYSIKVMTSTYVDEL